MSGLRSWLSPVTRKLRNPDYRRSVIFSENPQRSDFFEIPHRSAVIIFHMSLKSIVTSPRQFAQSADIEPEPPPLRARKSGPLTQIKGGFSRSQKIDRGFTSKSDPKIWPARQIKGGFLGLRPEGGGVLALYGKIYAKVDKKGWVKKVCFQRF